MKTNQRAALLLSTDLRAVLADVQAGLEALDRMDPGTELDAVDLTNARTPLERAYSALRGHPRTPSPPPPPADPPAA